MFLADAAVQTAPADARIAVYPASFFADRRPDNALDMVLRLPGFAFDPGGGQRGFAGGEPNVRIDGQLTASRSDGMAAILSRIPAASVERVELITGGAGGMDMRGRPIVANVVRKPGQGPSAWVQVGAQAAQDGRQAPFLDSSAELRRGERRYEVSARYIGLLDGGSGPRFQGLDALTASTWRYASRAADVGVTAVHERPWATGDLRLNAALSWEPWRTTRRDTPRGHAEPSLETTRSDDITGEMGLSYSARLNGGASLDLRAVQQLRRSGLASAFAQGASTSDFELERRLGETILSGSLHPSARGAWKFDVGLEGAFNWLEAATELSQDGAPVPLPAADVRVEELRGEAFVTATWKARTTLDAEVGLRLEGSRITSTGAVELSKTLAYLKPRLLLTWTPAAGHRVVLRAERLVSQLSFNDFSATASLTNGTVVAGNPDLEPEDTLQLEARYERTFWGRGAFTARYLRSRIDGLISRNLFESSLGAYEAQDNVGRGQRQTANLSLTVPTDRLGFGGGLIGAGFTARRSRMTDPITGERRGFSGETEWLWSASISREKPGSKWRWGAEASGHGEILVYQVSEIDISRLGVWASAYAEYRPSARLTWRLDLFDILQRDNPQIRRVYSAPRDIGAVSFIDRRDMKSTGGGRSAVLRVRRTF